MVLRPNSAHPLGESDNTQETPLQLVEPVCSFGHST